MLTITANSVHVDNDSVGVQRSYKMRSDLHYVDDHLANDSVGVQRSYKRRSDLHLPMIMLVFKDHIR